MINLPEDYKDVEPQQAGVYEKPDPGGYILVCTNIEEKQSAAGNDMVVLELDIAEGDHKGSFEKYPLKHYQLMGENHTGYFKGMLKSFHDSNPGHKPFVKGNQFDTFQLMKLKVGACLREEQYQKQDTGEIKVSMKVAYMCDKQRVLDGEVKALPLKKIANPKPVNQNMAFDSGIPIGQEPPLPEIDVNGEIPLPF